MTWAEDAHHEAQWRAALLADASVARLHVAEERPKALRERVLTRAALRDLPAPRPLIDNTLDQDTVALVAGYHGSGKSFLALDWALCVATGKAWQGRPVATPGPVLYVAAEGASGLDGRVSAWEYAWQHEADDLHVLPFAVNLRHAGGVRELAAAAKDMGARLLIIDTLARSIVGSDENSAKDMGEAVDAADRLRRWTGATVLLVHHTGKDKATVRGSSALEAGVDTAYAVESDGLLMSLKRTKRKDGPQVDEHRLRLRPIPDMSCVVESHSAVRQADDFRDRETALLRHLCDTYSSTGATRTDLLETTPLARATHYRALNALLRAGAVVNEGTDSRPRYRAVRGAENE